MNLKLLLAIFLIFNLNLYAQSIYQIAYHDSLDHFSSDFVKNGKGGYCITGSTKDVSVSGKTKILIFNIDSEGNLIWEFNYSGITSVNPEKILITNDNGFVVLASVENGPLSMLDILLMKIDSAGSLVWSQVYGGNLNDFGSGLLLAKDDGFYISGRTESFGSATSSALIMKVDQFGAILWSVIGSSLHYSTNSFQSICFDYQDNLIASGYAGNSILTAKLDTNGFFSELKAVISNTNNPVNFTTCRKAANGEIVQAGVIDGTNGYTDMLVARYDTAGNSIWQKKYDYLGIVHSITEDSFHNLHISGDMHHIPSYQKKPYILSLDNSGNFINATSYFDLSTQRSLPSILLTDDSMLAALGDQRDGNEFKIVLVKTELNHNSGCQQVSSIPTVQDVLTTDLTGFNQQFAILNSAPFLLNQNASPLQSLISCYNNSISEFSDSKLISHHPNPTSGIFKVTLSDYNVHLFSVYNSLGQKVMENKIGQKFADIDLSNFLPGIYFFRIDNLESRKIILTGN